MRNPGLRINLRPQKYSAFRYSSFCVIMIVGNTRGLAVYKDSEPADYCIIGGSPESRLSQFERLTLTGGEELERALNWASKQFASFDFQNKLGAFDEKVFFETARRYAERNSWNEGWYDDPARYFVKPTELPTVTERIFHGLKDGEIYDASYVSSYQARYEGFSSELDKFAENKFEHVRMWRHRDKGRPALVAIHGWTMGDQRINSLAFLPGLFYQLGFDVALVELPYHGRRRPQKESDLGGFLFPSIDLVRTNETMGQVISDLRELRLYLERDGASSVGCVGMSLGAYIGVLWASLDSLGFCVPIVPMVSMAELAWEIITRDNGLAGLREHGLTLDLLEQVYRVHCPLTYLPKTAKDRMLIIAGIGDQIVPSRQPKLLWDHWKRPRISWFQGGHVAQLKRSRVFQEITSFFGDLKLIQTPS